MKGLGRIFEAKIPVGLSVTHDAACERRWKTAVECLDREERGRVSALRIGTPREVPGAGAAGQTV